MRLGGSLVRSQLPRCSSCRCFERALKEESCKDEEIGFELRFNLRAWLLMVWGVV